MGVRKEQPERVIERYPRDVTLLLRARRDLLALLAVERRMLVRHIDALAIDPLPRGASPLDGRHRDHLRLRVGRFRLLYRVTERELSVVAVTARDA
jgi:mRNA-degrading endonuclease RelE of RelBE toxin-antitoxin system